MRDAELRGKLLKEAYRLRHNNGGWVPTTDLNVSGGKFVEAQVIAGICEQLAEAGLIQWKPLIGAQEGFVIGMAKITGAGVDVIDGERSPPIVIDLTEVKQEGIDGYNALLSDAKKIGPEAVRLVEFAGRERAELLILAGIKEQQTGSSFVKNSQGIRIIPRNFFDLIEAELKKIEIASSVPNQSLAPLRVEERNGKISRSNDQDAPIDAPDQDFDEWRQPIIDHIREFLSQDFRSGTNHSRLRDRLVALNEMLPGSIQDVKERQFRIGYEVSRLEGLVTAYRSNVDDMPALQIGILEDLTRLSAALLIGLSKFSRWAEFRRIATDDPTNIGSTDPALIRDALDRMATEMERQSDYFDSELPKTLRFLSEAVQDPMGAGKSAVYGAVRSIENVIIFLGQTALGTITKTADAMQRHISGAIATALVVGLSNIAIEISSALPAHWPWLRPLLDALNNSPGPKPND